MTDVEARLAMPKMACEDVVPREAAPSGFVWATESWIACDARACALTVSGSYYPDHVVFLGPALPRKDHAGAPPVIVREGPGLLLCEEATPSQMAMLRCLSDLLSRLPESWTPEAIGAAAESELLNWDAEKYRQALAART